MASEEVSQNEEPYVTLLHREVRKGGEFLEKVRAQENEDYAKKAEVPVIDFIRHGDCKSYQNIVDFLLETQTPGAEETTRLIWLDDKAREKLNIDIFEFYSQIRYLAKKLKDKGVKRGDRVVLVYPPCFDFIPAFYACLYIGAIAVPVAPLNIYRITDIEVKKFNKMVDSCGAVIGLTNEAFSNAFKALKMKMTITADSNKKLLPKLKLSTFVIGSASVVAKEENLLPKEEIYYPETSQETAYLQYTSGSTSAPKGVMVTHDNYLSNARSIFVRFPVNKHSITVNWAPQYHDLGLIYGPFCMPYMSKALFISAMSFVANPMLLPQMLTKYGGDGKNFCVVNNFALLHTVRTARKKKVDAAQFDYSSLICHGIGGDFALPSTYVSYCEYTSKAKMPLAPFGSSWGQAEVTCAGTTAVPHHVKTAKVIMVHKEALAEGRVQVLNTYEFEVGKKLEENQEGLWMMPAGAALMGMEIAIVNPDTLELCPADTVGEVWARGPGTCAGYYRLPDKTEETFRARIARKKGEDADEEDNKWENEKEFWVRSGDLGFLYNDQLFITSRIKDVIIVNGKNFCPGDLEESAHNASNVVRKGNTVAVAITEIDVDSAEASAKKKESQLSEKFTDGQQVVIIAEVRPWKEVTAEDAELKKRKQEEVYEEVCKNVREAVLGDHRVPVQGIYLVKKGSILKTSSGKKRRLDMKTMLIKGALPIVYSSRK